ncbi:aminoglycoside phosphotransferase (APT) family kinase protein [Paenibacillus sp. PastF-3]|uniref:phosphotransferase family protein n=1 Tax=Paenibacillus sp. PastF-3 TaxID=2940626 RepID=UPI002476586A|nr:aminoglycoside phosphotransferase family protein [Paenibacillus sp. PastF-3]MDH6368333.1 aminoglycoside phosphotransferase (APT) family kinase protein [Paenibacillus sp. PastF-3]
MESFTKTKLTTEQQSDLVGATFGSHVSIQRSTELTGGYFNAAYDLLLSDGRDMILKIAPSAEADTLSYEHDIMSVEVAAMRLMKSNGTVPVPRVYAYDNSKEMISSEFFFMEKIVGQPYNEIKEELSSQQRMSIEEELGRYSRLINEIPGERFGLFSASTPVKGTSWRETFKHLIMNLLEDARRLKVEMPIPLESVEAEIKSRLHVMDAVVKPRLIHWDLWDGNVFVREGRIVALIDWERALWGDPLMEYYFRYIENSEHFCRGYGDSFDSPNECARKKLYDLYIDLIYFIECYSRKYDSQGHLKWAHDNLLEGWKRFMN